MPHIAEKCSEDALKAMATEDAAEELRKCVDAYQRLSKLQINFMANMLAGQIDGMQILGKQAPYTGDGVRIACNSPDNLKTDGVCREAFKEKFPGIKDNPTPVEDPRLGPKNYFE